MKSFIRAALAMSMAIAAALAVSAPPALAHNPPPGSQTYTFTACSSNSAANVATAQAQMSVNVYDLGGGQVAFDFHNTGSVASSITDVYFMDGPLFGIASITDGPGTSFHNPATPGDLPSGNTCTPPFHVTEQFSADSDAGPGGGIVGHGANPGEYVVINFTLASGKTFADVVSALNGGALRIGIHVQGFTCPPSVTSCSESLVNTTPTAVSLAALGATAAHGQVTLAWRTGTESSNAGFNVYRATSASGARVMVNAQLIAAQGSEASGASYNIVDRPGYGSFYYWLESVDYTGQTSLHGPTRVSVRAAVQRPQYRPTLPSLRR